MEYTTLIAIVNTQNEASVDQITRLDHEMPSNHLDGEDLKRGNRFEKICDHLFPGVANVDIGRLLAGLPTGEGKDKGYSEGSIRRWKAGGPIGNTAVMQLYRRGASLEYLFNGEGPMLKSSLPPLPEREDLNLHDPRIVGASRALMDILATLQNIQLQAFLGQRTPESYSTLVEDILDVFEEHRVELLNLQSIANPKVS